MSLAFLALLIALIALTPLLGVLKMALSGGAQDWPHIARFVLPNTLSSTFAVLGITTIISAIFGVGAAWLVSFCQFKFRRILSVALVLPFAVPTFVSAYYWVEFLSFSGPAQSVLRAATGYKSLAEYWFPSINNVWGLSFIYASALYPYVFMTVRVLFVSQSARLIESARLLGADGPEVFWRIALPLARPAIAVGIALVGMEALNDIGAAEYLGVDMLALSVFHTWLNRNSLPGATHLALLILLLVILLLWVEHKSRKSPVMSLKTNRSHIRNGYQLSGWRAILAIGFCSLPILLGFVVPVFSILQASAGYLVLGSVAAIWPALINSITVSSGAAFACVAASIILVGTARQIDSPLLKGSLKLAVLGYGVPGTVLGLGTLVALAGFDNAIDRASVALFGVSTGLIFTGTIFGLIFVCSIRFLAISHGALSAEMKRASKSIDYAALSLGHGPWRIFTRLHLPLLARASLVSGLLVFVDTLKELSASIVLLPPQFLTLATYLYQKASNSLVDEGGIAALAMVLAGLVPIIIVQKQLDIQASSYPTLKRIAQK